MSRALGIDPGESRTGFALSDLTQTIATPYMVYRQTSRTDLVQKVKYLVEENNVEKIIIGQALDPEGGVGYQARRSIRLADAIQDQLDMPVVLWDESYTTKDAIYAQNLMQTRRKKKKNTLDAVAAAIILQSYLDANRPSTQG